MLKVEYLIFNDKKNVKSSDLKSFIHLLQSDPEINIKSNKISYESYSTDFEIEYGKVENSENIYFHLSFICNNVDEIENFTKLLRAIKSIINLTNKNPQVLYDGVSLYYAKLAYPNIFEIENLMRKLISKFMLINAGVEWSKERTPDDVRKSINSENTDNTYLHNVDFIQLSNFLFSENYPIHKDNLIKKLKLAKKIEDINIEEIKSLIPTSNWDKYFSDKISISKEELSKNWEDLYKLRCKIAHNKTFNKTDLEKSIELCESLKINLIKAIDSLNNIKLSKLEQADVTEKVAGNFNFLFGDFISNYRILEETIDSLHKKYTKKHNLPDQYLKKMFHSKLNFLKDNNIIDLRALSDLASIFRTRNKIVHNDGEIDKNEIKYNLDIMVEMIEYLKKIEI